MSFCVFENRKRPSEMGDSPGRFGIGSVGDVVELTWGLLQHCFTTALPWSYESRITHLPGIGVFPAITVTEIWHIYLCARFVCPSNLRML